MTWSTRLSAPPAPSRSTLSEPPEAPPTSTKLPPATLTASTQPGRENGAWPMPPTRRVGPSAPLAAIGVTARNPPRPETASA